MMRPHTAIAAREPMDPDALLVYRIAAVSDRTALAELDVRHGLTLYALAYSLMFNGEAADTAVAEAFRNVWRGAAAFDPSRGSVRQWLADLTRRAVQDRLRSEAGPRRRPLSPGSRVTAVASIPARLLPRSRRSKTAWVRLSRVAASLVGTTLPLA
jgi:RNA polymerase sigma-70 factor, ECF subfamily